MAPTSPTGSPKQGSLLKVGKTIREARKRRNLSLQNVSAAVGRTFSYFSKIERGEVVASRETYEKICDLLDLDKEELLPEIGIMTSAFEAEVVRNYQEVQGFLRRRNARKKPNNKGTEKKK